MHAMDATEATMATEVTETYEVNEASDIPSMRTSKENIFSKLTFLKSFFICFKINWSLKTDPVDYFML